LIDELIASYSLPGLANNRPLSILSRLRCRTLGTDGRWASERRTSQKEVRRCRDLLSAKKEKRGGFSGR